MKTKEIFLCIVILSIVLTVIACGGNEDPSSPIVDPILTGSVSITGTAMVGQTLTANINALGGNGIINYQWKRNVYNNIGTNTNTYVLQATDEGSTISVTVTRTGYSGSITSSATATVIANTPPALTGSVSITGITTVGQTLTANTDSLGGSGDLSYQWKRGNSSTAAGTNITDAITSIYTLVTADEGKYITVTVTRAGNSGSVTGGPTNAIAAAPTLTGTVSITGTAKVGQTLTANTSSLGGSGAISYQWRSASGSSFSNITGATSSTYVLTADDFGKYINVVVTRSGNSGSATSPSTSAVVDIMAWTQVSQSIFTSSTTINSIVYNGTNLWIAVGNGKVAPSTNGTTWEETDYVNLSNVRRGAYGGDKWILVGSSGSMMTSTNGQKPWSTIPASSISSIFGFIQDGNQYYRNIDGIVYGNGRWIVFGSGQMGTSTDGGTTWTLVTQPLMTINNIAYGNNQWIAVGSVNTMAISTDGVNWTPIDVSNIFSGSGQTIQTITYGNGLWIAAGTNGKMATSTNGINWTLVPGNPFGTGTIQTIAYNNNKWIAGGSNSSTLGIDSGSRIAFSSDGINWTSVAYTTFGSNIIKSIAFGGGKWVAVGDGGRIAYANDN